MPLLRHSKQDDDILSGEAEGGRTSSSHSPGLYVHPRMMNLTSLSLRYGDGKHGSLESIGKNGKRRRHRLHRRSRSRHHQSSSGASGSSGTDSSHSNSIDTILHPQANETSNHNAFVTKFPSGFRDVRRRQWTEDITATPFLGSRYPSVSNSSLSLHQMLKRCCRSSTSTLMSRTSSNHSTSEGLEVEPLPQTRSDGGKSGNDSRGKPFRRNNMSLVTIMVIVIMVLIYYRPKEE